MCNMTQDPKVWKETWSSIVTGLNDFHLLKQRIASNKGFRVSRIERNITFGKFGTLGEGNGNGREHFSAKNPQRGMDSQQTQEICITFVQRLTNVFDVGPTLYKCYTNILCLLGFTSQETNSHKPVFFLFFPGSALIFHRDVFIRITVVYTRLVQIFFSGLQNGGLVIPVIVMPTCKVKRLLFSFAEQRQYQLTLYTAFCRTEGVGMRCSATGIAIWSNLLIKYQGAQLNKPEVSQYTQAEQVVLNHRLLDSLTSTHLTTHGIKNKSH